MSHCWFGTLLREASHWRSVRPSRRSTSKTLPLAALSIWYRPGPEYPVGDCAWAIGIASGEILIRASATRVARENFAGAAIVNSSCRANPLSELVPGIHVHKD